MRLSSFFHFATFGVKTILFGKKNPILGTVIVTDKCNLHCKHCSVNNITAVVHPYEQIRNEMQQLYDMGIRILFFCGGETFLWKDGERNLRDLVIEAKQMGFLIVNVVTNGTFPIDLPEADLILLSLDGDKQCHNEIRGDTYDIIMKNISNATADNICFYMAINQINKEYVRDVCITARDTKNVRAVSFNFHTPYLDTKELALTREEKAACCATITQMMKEGAPVFNLKSAFRISLRTVSRRLAINVLSWRMESCLLADVVSRFQDCVNNVAISLWPSTHFCSEAIPKLYSKCFERI